MNWNLRIYRCSFVGQETSHHVIPSFTPKTLTWRQWRRHAWMALANKAASTTRRRAGTFESSDFCWVTLGDVLRNDLLNSSKSLILESNQWIFRVKKNIPCPNPPRLSANCWGARQRSILVHLLTTRAILFWNSSTTKKSIDVTLPKTNRPPLKISHPKKETTVVF